MNDETMRVAQRFEQLFADGRRFFDRERFARSPSCACMRRRKLTPRSRSIVKK